MIDDQLKWIIDFLGINNLIFWIDSGTLLGIVRDGHIIKNDNDIDIGMWASDIDNVLNTFEKQNLYKIKIFKYKKYLYKIKLYNKYLRYTIDINFFRIKNNDAWCPQPISINYNNLFIIKKYYLSVLYPFIYRLKRIWPFSIDYNNLFWKPFYTIGVWLIPKTFFKELILFDSLRIPVPKQYNSYLNLRYGNWKEKCPNWIFWRDDGGFKFLIDNYL